MSRPTPAAPAAAVALLAANACDIVWNSNSIVNNGSGDVKAPLNNLVSQNADSTGGVVHVTPTTVLAK